MEGGAGEPTQGGPPPRGDGGCEVLLDTAGARDLPCGGLTHLLNGVQGRRKGLWVGRAREAGRVGAQWGRWGGASEVALAVWHRARASGAVGRPTSQRDQLRERINPPSKTGGGRWQSFA